MRIKTTKASKTEAAVVHPSHLKGGTLPPDWEWVSLGNICRTTSGGTPSRKNKEYFEGDIPWVKSGELLDGPVSEVEEYITGEAVKNSSAKQFPKGTLLIALYGATVGKLGVLTKEAATNQAVCAIFPPDYLETKYLFWYLRFVRSGLIAQAIGGAQPNISQGIIRNILIPVAPRYEQKRIVAEIEKQFSRLDEAVVTLKRVKANLKRYKASVLKAAVEGKLTEEWRKQHPDAEPASKLLERILAERRAKVNGRAGYSAPAQPDISNLPDLPNEWVWVRLDAIAALKGGITVDKNRKSSTARTVPYLRVANVQRGYLDLSEVKEIKAPEADIRDLRLVPGDILFNEGGDRDKLGRGWVWEGQLSKCIHQNHVFRARLYLTEVSPKLVSWWGNSFGQAYFLREGKQTTNLASLNLTKLSAFPIPLPSPAEQQQITAEVERRLSVIEELQATAGANLTCATRLRQSVLSSAFSGKLVMPSGRISHTPPSKRGLSINGNH